MFVLHLYLRIKSELLNIIEKVKLQLSLTKAEIIQLKYEFLRWKGEERTL